MSILIIGGTGTVGSATTRRLVADRQPVRVLTRSEDRRAKLPASVEGVVGDLEQPGTLDRALRGIRRVFLITPLARNEADQGRHAVEAARRAGVERLVLLSVHDVERGEHIPHFRSKVEIERAIREARLPHTVLMPNGFFQNDLWFRTPIVEHGVYPQPIGEVGMSSVAVRDIADAAAAALTGDGHLGGRYPLVGPEVMTGPSTAAAWSRVLGREVRYAGNDLDAWAERAREMLPPWLVEDLRTMYAFFIEHGLRASDEDLRRQSEILGHAPRRFDAFAAETAQEWIPPA